MGRILACRNMTGRVATAITLAIIAMTAAACGDSEPVTAKTVIIQTNPDTKRPECSGDKTITLSESASPNPLARAASAWGEPTLTIETLGNIRLDGVLATEGREHHGFYNLTPRDMKAGDTIFLEARKFTVSPDITATMTTIDSVTLCVAK